MSDKIDMIWDDNTNFYQDPFLLENAAYVKTLGLFNIYAGILYIFVSLFSASMVKDCFKKYLFVRKAGVDNTDLDGMEVLEWATRQMESTRWDWIQFVIILLSILMIALVILVSFRVKKYELYKHQRKCLLLMFSLGAAQMLVAAIGPAVTLRNFTPFPLIASFALHILILFPQIFGGELFYPLEFKNISGVLEVLNFLVERFLKARLDEKQTWKGGRS